MATMESSNPTSKGELLCTIRRVMVKDSPEERLRQTVLQRMVSEWGYPPSLIVVEKSLKQLPTLTTFPSLSRRVDVLVLKRNPHPDRPYSPLLLIEFKAARWSNADKRQLTAYAHFIQPSFCALVDPERTLLFNRSHSVLYPTHALPPYAALCSGGLEQTH